MSASERFKDCPGSQREARRGNLRQGGMPFPPAHLVGRTGLRATVRAKPRHETVECKAPPARAVQRLSAPYFPNASARSKAGANHGYEGTSTAELLTSMGLARQSLYGAFGDKRRLFLKALERDNRESVAKLVDALGARQDSLDALEAALLAFARPGAQAEAGCLGLGSITEFGRSDPDINAINEASARTFLAALATRICAGMAEGAIGDVDPQEAARFLLAIRSGLKVAARGGADLEALRPTVRLALRSLRP